MSLVRFRCAHCNAEAFTESGAFNRAKSLGKNLYCGRECSGLGRRNWKTPAQRKADKQAYDARRRVELADEIRAAKREHHKRTYDPVKAAAERKLRMPRHVEYCRRPEYREWKREYDRTYRAKKEYGDFADCFLLVMDIRDECLRQMTDYEIRYAKGGVAKAQQRRRAYDRLNREDLEDCPVGNLELGQGWQDGGFAS